MIELKDSGTIFLRYVDGKAAEGPFTKTVEQEVLRVKEHRETRREYMTLAMEMKRRENIVREEERKEIILNMASMQMPTEVIAKAVRSTPEFIEKVLNQKPATVRQ